MTRLPGQLAERGIAVELHMVGDKIQADPSDPLYPRRMEKALRGSPGVTWHAVCPRLDAIKTVASCRHRPRLARPRARRKPGAVDEGPRIRRLGLPVVLNRTPMHEAPARCRLPAVRRFGGRRGRCDRGVDRRARSSADRGRSAAGVAAAGLHLEQRAVERVRRPARRALPERTGARRPRRVRCGSWSPATTSSSSPRLLDHLQSMPELEVRRRRVAGARTRTTPSRAGELVDWADVIICEWCGPNAVWYSKHRRTGQRLFVRLHRFELYRRLAGAARDRRTSTGSSASAPSYAQLTREHHRLAEDKVSVIPNWVDDRAARSTKARRAPGSTSA